MKSHTTQKHWIAIGPSKSGKSTLMESDGYVPHRLTNDTIIERDHQALSKARKDGFKMQNQHNPCFFHMDSDYIIEEPLRDLVKLNLINHVYITVRKDHEMRLLNRKKTRRGNFVRWNLK
jgi:ABC-type thiamine transport system ATPase subunit